MFEFVVKVKLKEPLNMSVDQVKEQIELQLLDDSVFEQIEVIKCPNI